MAALPLQYPDLALYLADESSTPIISSAGLALTLHEEDGEEEDSEAVHGSHADSTNHKPPSRRQRAAALDALTGTALRAREAAARLGLGLDYANMDATNEADAHQQRARTAMSAMAAWGMTPPEHVVVTYNTGAVLVESFLDPHQQQQQEQERQQLPMHLSSSQTPPQTASPASDSRDPPFLGMGQDSDIYAYTDENGVQVGHATNCGPLLVGLVVAPGEQSMRDARRATTQLQRIGRAVQRDWVAESQR